MCYNCTDSDRCFKRRDMAPRENDSTLGAVDSISICFEDLEATPFSASPCVLILALPFVNNEIIPPTMIPTLYCIDENVGTIHNYY